ncbi:hypothetical protein Q604_UNBC06812G0001, partial [human gut metagenome]
YFATEPFNFIVFDNALFFDSMESEFYIREMYE